MNFKKQYYFLLVLTLLFFKGAHGQDTISVINPKTTEKQKISFDAKFEASANSLNNQFVTPFIKGGFLTYELKNSVAQRLTSFNTAGYIYDFEAEYRFAAKKREGIDFFVSMESFSYNQLGFDSVLFLLIFNGNSAFAGENISLHNTFFNSHFYNNLKFGFGYTTKNKTHSVDVSLGVIMANKMNEISGENSSFYTSYLGDTLALQGKLTWASAQPANYFSVVGNGLSLSAKYLYTIENERELEIKISNLGLIKWNSNTNHFEQPSDFVYTGFEVENIFEIPDSLFKISFADSLNNYVEKNSSKTSFLKPSIAPFKLRYSHFFMGGKLGLMLGFDDYFFSRYTLATTLAIRYKPTKNIELQPFMMIGGFSSKTYGFAFGFRYGKKFQSKLTINYIDALVLPSELAGIGASLNLALKF